MKSGAGPEDLPQFEDRLLYHLVELTDDRPLQPGEGVTEKELVVPLVKELGTSPDIASSDEFYTSGTRGTILTAVRTLEAEGLLEVTGQWADIRPTRNGRRRAAQWRQEWERHRNRQDREIQQRILRELEGQWRTDPEMHKLRGHIDVERFCEEYGIEREAYLTNAYRLLDQGKVQKMPISEATPASGGIHITESGRRALEVATTAQRPQRDAQEAWVEVARLRRHLQIAERSLPSLIADDELRRRCEDLLAADAHYDRVVREACVILEDRVRKAVEAGKNAVGSSLMELAFGRKSGVLRLSEEEQDELGGMEI